MLQDDPENLELDKLHLENRKLVAEANKLSAEARKLARETRWYPIVAGSAIATAAGGILGLIIKL